MQIKLHFFKNQERRVLARFSRRSRFLFTSRFGHPHPNRVDLGRGYPRNVRFGSLADIPTSPRHIRFTPDNGVRRSLAVWIIQACENAVDLLFGLFQRDFLLRRHSAERRARQNGKIGTSRVDADAPLRPLPHRHDVVAATLLGTVAIWGLMRRPPVGDCLAETHQWGINFCLIGSSGERRGG